MTDVKAVEDAYPDRDTVMNAAEAEVVAGKDMAVVVDEMLWEL